MLMKFVRMSDKKSQQETIDKIREILSSSLMYQKIAEDLKEVFNIAILGNNYNYPVAKEGCLKFTEISYIHSSTPSFLNSSTPSPLLGTGSNP